MLIHCKRGKVSLFPMLLIFLVFTASSVFKSVGNINFIVIHFTCLAVSS